MPNITEDRIINYAESGYVYGAEYRNAALANDGTLFLKIAATTKPVTFNFGAGVEALTYVDSFISSTLTTPTTLTAYNYKPSVATAATAVVTTATAQTALGTQRGNTQVGSGITPGQSAGGSTVGRPTTLAPGESITLRLTNKGGAAKCTSIAVYWTEVQG